MTKPDMSFKVRMPAPLRDRIEMAALKNKRSINAEIVHRLELSFEDLSERIEILERENSDQAKYNEQIDSRLCALEGKISAVLYK